MVGLHERFSKRHPLLKLSEATMKSLVLTVSSITFTIATGALAGPDRSVLPIATPEAKVIKEIDARKAKAPPFFEVTAPKKAPNVVIVLIDDFGFGHSSPFGGPINMPTLQKLADNGIKYNRFHTTALCSPTRIALLTGRNHHAANAGSIMETATAFPGNTGIRPLSITPLAETLRQNGFSTAAFGKYHETPPWEASVSGPFFRWPTGSGFDKFYGFIGGETNQWAPAIYDGTNRVETPKDPDYHFTSDMTDKAIAWVKSQQSLTPDKPFFMYFATGATHAPHHAPKEWIEKYKGRFSQGWDKLREETYARQKKSGVIPQTAGLTERPKEIPAWNSFTAEEQKLLSRQMETFAGFASHTDHEVGRLMEALAETDNLNNTIIFYIAGDNGASAEGGPAGSYNELLGLNGIVATPKDNAASFEQWGGPKTYPHFAIGWAHAGNTPFQWTKQVASHFGGTRNGMVVHWPNGIRAKNETRNQFHHVIDVAPTVLAAAGLPEPKIVNGIKQRPMDGVSMIYSFDNAKAKDRRETQYFEMFGNRAIYHKGWTAVTRHSIPWKMTANLPDFDKDVWELYNVDEDFSQVKDLSSTNPKKLKELQAVFQKEAIRNHVYPLDDRRSERFNPEIAGRPDLMGDRNTLVVYEGMTGMAENAFINIKNRSFSVTAEVELPNEKASGVILSQAGRFGGWSIFMKEGRVHHEYNYFGSERTKISSSNTIGKGNHTIKYEFKVDGAVPGSGGKSILYINNQKVAEQKIPKTMPYFYSADEGVDVGMDNETPVSEEYKERDNKFTGKIFKVTVQIERNPMETKKMKQAQEAND
jgi:arylsulfatase